jgi:hypothetical protein
MSASRQRRPTAIIADTLSIRLNQDLAANITADIIFALQFEGYRLVSAQLCPDLDPVDIVARSLVDHMRITPTGAKDAAGWCLADLHRDGWRLARVDDPPPD